MTTKINYIGSSGTRRTGSIDVLLLLIQAEPLDYDRFPTGFVSLRADGSVLLLETSCTLTMRFLSRRTTRPCWRGSTPLSRATTP